MNLHDKYPSLEKANVWDCVAVKLALSLREVLTIYRKHLKRHGITMSQWSILHVLGYMGEVPQADLGKILKLDRSTITRDLKRLLKKGYLVRSGAVNKKNVGLSDAGAQFAQTILPDWKNATTEAKQVLGEDGHQALDLIASKFL